MEHKDLSGLEIKTDATQGIVTAYASVFSNVDSHRDRVMPGAFTKTISERAQRVRVLRDHDATRVVGKPQHMEEDSTGLLTVTKMMNTPLGQETLTLLKEGAIDELSIGFTVYQDAKNDFGGRDLREIKLYEYSYLPFASNSLALVQAIKSNADIEGFLGQLDRVIAVDLRGGTLSAHNLKRLKAAVIDAQGVFEGKAASFSNGDRVTVKGRPHMKGQGAGTIKLVNPGPAFGIEFDGMEDMGVHKWYVADELKAAPEEQAPKKPKTPGHSMSGMKEGAFEPDDHSEAAESTPEPDPHSELLTELKAWKPALSVNPDEAAILAELKAAFTPILQGN